MCGMKNELFLFNYFTRFHTSTPGLKSQRGLKLHHVIDLLASVQGKNNKPEHFLQKQVRTYFLLRFIVTILPANNPLSALVNFFNLSA